MFKCPHGVMALPGEVALYCSVCNPTPVEGGPIPELTRRTELSLPQNGRLPECTKCRAPIAVSNNGTCFQCGQEHILVSPEGLRANTLMRGICPECGSGAHYGFGKIWECCDCGHEYPVKK